MMSQPIINKRTLGVTFRSNQQAHVVVWAPQAKEVTLSINNHSISLPLTKDSSGYWRLTTNQLTPNDTYAFVLDNEKEWADPASLLQPQGVYGPSQAFDSGRFYWEDSSWVNPPIDEYIVYEIDIDTFTDEGTLKAIIRKLNQVKKLGVNAILIRPVTDFPNSRKQCRDASFLYAVQAAYGGPLQLQQLINACHYEGLSVLLDLSYKQADQPDQILIESAGYSARKRPAGESKTATLSAASEKAYRHYLIENALMWFRDFHVDALRLENIHTLPDSDRLLGDIRENTNELTAQTGRQYYLLVEQDLTLVTNGIKKSGSQQNPGQRTITGNNCNTYYMDFNHIRHQTKQYRKDCLCDSTFSSILQELFEREADMSSNEAFVTVLQTYEPSAQQIDSELIKLLAGSIMVSPCIPTLFMGEEWGVTNPFRRLLQNESVPAGSDHESLLLVNIDNQPASVLLWEMLDEQPNQTLYQYYQSLTALRRQQPALYHLNSKQAQVIYQDGEPTLLLHRSYKTNEVLCLMNFSPEKQSVTLPELGKSWEILLDSADPIWDGPGASPEELPDRTTLMLQPKSIVVYKAHS